MEISPNQPTAKGPAETFTGDVWIDGVVNADEPSRLRIYLVRFAPGARSAWHSHPVGQTLLVTDGRGRAQSRGEAVIEIRPGDVVRTPPHEWHWHGAAPDHFMAHLAVAEGVGRGGEGPDIEWGDHVTNADYLGQVP